MVKADFFIYIIIKVSQAEIETDYVFPHFRTLIVVSTYDYFIRYRYVIIINWKLDFTNYFTTSSTRGN